MGLLALGGSDCEALRDGLLGQPANALSSLAYVVAAAYVVRRGGPVGPAVALALVGVGSVLYHGPMPAGAELVHDGALVAVPATALVELRRTRSFPRPPVAAIALLGAGALVNALSRTGAPLCSPDSPAQGHAAWHVLTAAGAALWLACWGRNAGDASGGRRGRGQDVEPGRQRDGHRRGGGVEAADRAGVAGDAAP